MPDASRAPFDPVKAGTVRSIRVNEFMDPHNANKTGKGRPRLRIRGLPLKLVTPSLAGLHWRTTTRMPSASWGGATAGQVRGAGMVAGTQGWNSRMGLATGLTGWLALAFAPSAALDAWQSYYADPGSGQPTFHREEFFIRSARSQGGNAAGFVASGATGALVGTGVRFGVGIAIGLTGWPVILIGLAVGIVAQVAWNYYDRDDWAEGKARQYLK